MTKQAWKNEHRAARRAARKAEKIQGWYRWTAGMALVRELDNCPELLAMRERDAMIDRIGGRPGSEIGNNIY
jgi:hypothetical protein